MTVRRLSVAAPDVSIDTLWATAAALGMPAAAWRHPHQQTQHLIADLSGTPLVGRPDLETWPAGFAVAPFAGEKARLIRADLHFRDDVATPPVLGATPAAAAFGQALRQATRTQPTAWPPLRADRLIPTRGAVHYEAGVAAAVRAIEAGTFRKVVLSRTKTVDLPPDLAPVALFQRLCAAYPAAFVSLVYLPGEGVWLGATPELLVSVEQNTFRTMALAGTQPARPGETEADVRWGQKEIEEQALVSRYVVDCFKRIRLRAFDEAGPRTVRAGHLFHLRTDFTVDMRTTNFAELGTTMLGLLHPTSAVCGQPKAAAQHFLRTHEGYDRSFYSGYLGPVNIDHATGLFVNLRCVQLRAHPDGRHVATLYAGAGLTADSNPHQEWLETELKCETLLPLLRR